MAGPYSTNILDIRRTLIHGTSATVIAGGVGFSDMKSRKNFGFACTCDCAWRSRLYGSSCSPSRFRSRD